MKFLTATVLSIGLLAAAAPASAGVATPDSGTVAKQAAPQIENVQWRGRGWGGRGYGWRRGYGWGGVGAGIVAGAIIYDYAYRPRAAYRYYDAYDYDGPYYYPRGYTGDPRTICARNFRSFEWSTGYYTTYGGEHRLCPYLR